MGIVIISLAGDDIVDRDEFKSLQVGDGEFLGSVFLLGEFVNQELKLFRIRTGFLAHVPVHGLDEFFVVNRF